MASVAFQSILRKQIRKLPKILKSVKLIQYYSILSIRVLRPDAARARAEPRRDKREAPAAVQGEAPAAVLRDAPRGAAGQPVYAHRDREDGLPAERAPGAGPEALPEGD